MSITDLERLVRKYYGYVADLEGSRVEVLDLLFVRDKIQSILDQLTPDEALPSSLYQRIYELDSLLWEERSTFLLVAGQEELRHARRGQGSPRSHWWVFHLGGRSGNQEKAHIEPEGLSVLPASQQIVAGEWDAS